MHSSTIDIDTSALRRVSEYTPVRVNSDDIAVRKYSRRDPMRRNE